MSWFSRLASGLFCCSGYKPHYILNTHLGPHCIQHHLLDPITVVSECASTSPMIIHFNDTWITLFNHMVKTWWTLATKGERRNYICLLISKFLSNLLTAPPGYHLSLKKTPKATKENFGDCHQEAKNWLWDNPLPDIVHISASSSENLWTTPLSCYSTSSAQPTPLRFAKQQQPPPPPPRPHRQTSPPKSKSSQNSANRSNLRQHMTPPNG